MHLPVDLINFNATVRVLEPLLVADVTTLWVRFLPYGDRLLTQKGESPSPQHYADMTRSVLPPPPLAAFLKNRQLEKRLSVEAFAEKLSCKTDTIKDIYDGKTQAARPKTLAKINKFIEESYAQDSERANSLKDQLVEINNLARRTYGGPFPFHLEALRRLVNQRPRDCVDILVDCADYGSFFHPALHRLIVKMLVDLRKSGRAIRMLVAGPIRPITSAAEFIEMKHEERMADMHFIEYLNRYIEYLRDEKSTDAQPFREWLDEHKADDCREILSWVKCYAQQDQVPSADELCAWMNRASSTVYNPAGTFTASRDDGGPLLALLWSRERYFEEMLLRSGVALKRAGALPPAITFWLSGKRAIYVFNETKLEERGWAFSTLLVAKDERPRKISVLKSVFENHWTQAPEYKFLECAASTAVV
ncbi:MAG TPA: hypothetical protein VFO29_01550 [Candidatus Rubrimentiphilum sp.]|nr:hypothetical protein [Candidatus Rubrimentiphilum sp.]